MVHLLFVGIVFLLSLMFRIGRVQGSSAKSNTKLPLEDPFRTEAPESKVVEPTDSEWHVAPSRQDAALQGEATTAANTEGTMPAPSEAQEMIRALRIAELDATRPWELLLLVRSRDCLGHCLDLSWAFHRRFAWHHCGQEDHHD